MSPSLRCVRRGTNNPRSDCSEKAFQAHKLIHWRHALNEVVTEKLEKAGHLTDERIARRLAASPDRRWKKADKLFQEWKTEGRVDRLWLDFKKMMEEARNYEPKRYGRVD
jgi:hypothetical protein